MISHKVRSEETEYGEFESAVEYSNF